MRTSPFRPGRPSTIWFTTRAATRLLQKAEADGANAIGGIGMLIWQGAIAFERWTGIMPPVEVMRDAIHL